MVTAEAQSGIPDVDTPQEEIEYSESPKGLEIVESVGSVRTAGPEVRRQLRELSRNILDTQKIAAHRGMAEADVFYVLVKGWELGFSPMAALDNIYVVNGRTTLSAQAMHALAIKHGIIIQFSINYDKDGKISSVTAKITRTYPNGQTVTHEETWTMQEAHQADLTGKDNWRKYPKLMLRNRAIASGLRVVIPDILMGLYLPDEAEDMDPVEARVTASSSADDTIDASAEDAEPTEPTETPETGPTLNETEVSFYHHLLGSMCDRIAEKTQVDRSRLIAKAKRDFESWKKARFGWTDTIDIPVESPDLNTGEVVRSREAMLGYIRKFAANQGLDQAEIATIIMEEKAAAPDEVATHVQDAIDAEFSDIDMEPATKVEQPQELLDESQETPQNSDEPQQEETPAEQADAPQETPQADEPEEWTVAELVTHIGDCMKRNGAASEVDGAAEQVSVKSVHSDARERRGVDFDVATMDDAIDALDGWWRDQNWIYRPELTETADMDATDDDQDEVADQDDSTNKDRLPDQPDVLTAKYVKSILAEHELNDDETLDALFEQAGLKRTLIQLLSESELRRFYAALRDYVNGNASMEAFDFDAKTASGPATRL